MVLKNIWSGISRIIPEKNRKHVRVDVGSDKNKAEATLRRAANNKRFIPKVVRKTGRVGEAPQMFVRESDMAT